MIWAPLSSEFFHSNRKQLADLLAPGSLVRIDAGEQVPRNGDQFYPYRVKSEFYYLTGLQQPGSVFLFFPDHPDPKQQSLLFIQEPTERNELWNGPMMDQQEARERSGIQEVFWLEDLSYFENLLLLEATNSYIPEKQSLSPYLNKLRTVKKEEEIVQIRQAIAITHSAFLRVLRALKPGMMEYEIEAELIAEFIRRGAQGHAFEPIVASGRNALVLHYVRNRDLCREGDLLLLDFGAELNNYAADCSRTVPVSGRFSPRQREVYDAVLRVLRQAREWMRPGTIMADFHASVGQLWEEEHLRLGIYTQQELDAHQGQEPLWKKYFMHGTSHSLGLDVHDPFDRSLPFAPGMVFTLEPAIYLPEEGMGIRLENDILISENGAVDLMADFPIEADEIELLMNS